MKDYLKDKWILLTCFGLFFLFMAFSLLAVGVRPYGVWFLVGLFCVLCLSFFLVDMVRKVSYMKKLEKTMDSLRPNYLIGEVMDEHGGYEMEKMRELLRRATKSMNDTIADYKKNNREYREYVEMWVHEIKTPIASSMLLIENHPSEVSESLRGELSKIDHYINQALYYAKSNSVDKDYIIKECNLGAEVKKSIRKKSGEFILSNISCELGNLDYTIYTDPKWLEFILGQIFDNAIKYFDKAEKKLNIRAVENQNDITLLIGDNGMGIGEKDLPKVFQKGFTGENGRKENRSTGIGLYLCKKLCDKLGLGLGIQSSAGEGTVVTITFPKSKYVLLED